MKILLIALFLTSPFLVSTRADPVLHIHDFCQQMDLPPEVLDRIATFPKLDASQVQRVDSTGPDWSWLYVQTPNELIKREAIWMNLQRTGYPVRSVTEIRQLQKTMAHHQYSAPTDAEINDVKNMCAGIRSGKTGGFSGIPFTVNKNAYLECEAIYGEGKSSGCSKAVNEMLVDQAPAGNYGLFLEDLMADVILNPAYRVPLNHYAAQLIDHLFDPSLTNKNAFDDLYTEFVKDGLSNEDAIAKTMNAFAFISLNGPDLYMILSRGWLSKDRGRIKYFDDNILLALHFIATIAPVLDLRQNNHNLPMYFLPPTIQSTCLNGKYYHFWMAAWWSWHFASKYTDSNEQGSAMLGSWLVAKSYQKFSSTYGRKFLQALTEPLYADYANHERRDLSYYAEATRFGRQLANLKTTDWTKYEKTSVDDSFQTLMSKGVEIDIQQATKDVDYVDQAFHSKNDVEIVLALPAFSKLSRLWDKMMQVDLIYSK